LDSFGPYLRQPLVPGDQLHRLERLQQIMGWHMPIRGVTTGPQRRMTPAFTRRPEEASFLVATNSSANQNKLHPIADLLSNDPVHPHRHDS
jgi:hypothetical protein